jgi:transposase
MLLTDKSPDHSSLTRISDRLPLPVYEQVFAFVLDLVDAQGLLKGQTVAVDSTLLEANAAMKVIVRKETGEDWNEYLTQLMREEGVLDEDRLALSASAPNYEPTDEERRRFDKRRAKSKQKRVSNKDWESPADADARIVKMKDGRTHLGYKAEHVVDLETDVILSAQVHHGTEGDSQTLTTAVIDAQTNLINANCDAEIEEVVADSLALSASTPTKATTLTTRSPNARDSACGRTSPSRTHHTTAAGPTIRTK